MTRPSCSKFPCLSDNDLTHFGETCDDDIVRGKLHCNSTVKMVKKVACPSLAKILLGTQIKNAVLMTL